MPYETCYDVFAAWKSRCLDKSGSLLSEKNLWREEVLERVNRAISVNVADKDDFFEKYIKQLSKDDTEAWLLLLEIDLLHSAPRGMSVELFFNRLRENHLVTEETAGYETLKRNVEQNKRIKSSTGQDPLYNLLKSWASCYYLSLALQYKRDESLRALIDKLQQGDPCWREAEERLNVENVIGDVGEKKLAYPSIVMSMFCKDYHFAIYSEPDRDDIVREFKEYLNAGDEHKTENEKLYVISRELLSENPGLPLQPMNRYVDFYSDEIKSKWKSGKKNKDKDKTTDEEIMDTDVERLASLLKQCYQIILQGPPGTGKTLMAKQIVQYLLGDDWKKKQGNRWEIIQFHPSYNYEDFVRGIQITTTESGAAQYETKDRVLVEMAQRAGADSDHPYVLIIDEINRANVAAVLGELIYALEYRGEEVRTTYAKDDKSKIMLPKNLYLIGTMNTADRTIGQIDYAVRRRFAFETLSPDRQVVAGQSSGIGEEALWLFDKVAGLFAEPYLSSDYDESDVKIGHSYFLANDMEKLQNKIRYQVIPILHEYVKDGVLSPNAREKIDELAELLEEMEEDEIEESDSTDQKSRSGRRGKWHWRHEEHGTEGNNLPINRMILSIVKDWVEYKKPQNIDELRIAFPDRLQGSYGVVQFAEDAKKKQKDGRKRYFHDDPIILPDGNKTAVCCTSQWGAKRGARRVFERVKKRLEELGYVIGEESPDD